MTALTYPLARALFANLLRVREVEFDLIEQIETSGQGSGNILTADVGPRLWRGEVVLTKGTHRQAARIEALISVLREPGASFLVWDPRHVGPEYDPDGSILGAAVPSVLQVAANNREMAVAGLPVGYRLQIGDLLTIEYTDPAGMYGLHRVVSLDTTADAQGETPLFEVTPHIRSTPSIGDQVHLVRPFCKAIIDPGTVRPSKGRKVFSDGIGFGFIQKVM